MTTVAAFDVDGTVTRRDCVVPFMRRVTGARRVVPRLAARPDRLLPLVARRDRDQLKALAAAAAFRGQTEATLLDQGAAFAEAVRADWLRTDTMQRLRAHLDAGDRVVFVSASFEVYLRPLAALLGIDEALGTRLEMRGGVATGALDGPNCRGPEKVRRLHEWLEREHLDRAVVHIVAYGDSAGDRELLAEADEAHWMTRNGSAA
jgi:phosphatidylglycerophosphatase C